MSTLFRIIVFLLSYHWIFAQDGPVVSDCPVNILHVIPFGQTSIQVTWTPPSSPDIATISGSTHDPPATFNPGEEVVTYTFLKDGVSTECKFTVEVQQVDTTPPSITGCPTEVAAIIGYSEDTVPVDWVEPTATDNSGTVVTISKRSHQPRDPFPRGFTFVEYIFTDASGNNNSCNFAVTASLDDVVPPIVSGCPSDIERSVENHQVYEPVTWMEPTATDDASSDDVDIVRRSHSPGDRFGAGVTNVLYVFSDGSQNNAICTFQIHLSPPESPSVHSCPRSIIHDDSDPEPQINDPEFITTNAISNDIITRDNRNYTRFQIDGSNLNTIICSYEIYRFTVDNVPPPAASCTLEPRRVTATLGSGGETVEYPTPQNTADISHRSGSVFPVGETVVAYVVQDDGGNIRVCSFRVLVSPAIIGCPPRTISGDAKTDGTELRVHWPSPQSAVRAAETNPPSHTSGSSFPLGTTEVSHLFTDATGNTESCVFHINVKQANPLTISNCPFDMNFILSEDSSTVVVTWMEPEPMNNFDGASPVLELDQSHDSGSSFPLGDTPVIYRYVDSSRSEFTVNCTFVVTVEDKTNPTVVGCQDRYELSAFVWYGTFEWESLITVTDNSDVFTVTTSPSNDYQYLFEETNFTLIAVDSSGNEATCEAIVIFSLFLPVPLLIVIGVVLLFILLALIICCCRCWCRCRNRAKDGDDGRTYLQDSQTTPQNDSSARKTSTTPQATLPRGNQYMTKVTSTPYAPPVNTVDNPTYKPEAGGYTYIEGDTVQYAKDIPPPLPTTPRPGSNGDTYPGDKYLKPKDSSQVYLHPTGQNPNDSPGYIYPDRNGGDQSYIYPDLQPAEYSYSYDHTMTGRGSNGASGSGNSFSAPVPTRRNVPSYFEPVQ